MVSQICTIKFIYQNIQSRQFFTTYRGVYNFVDPTPSLRPIELQPRELYPKGPKPREP